jgi:hypothetical protein
LPYSILAGIAIYICHIHVLQKNYEKMHSHVGCCIR